ncbi:hypothetical protein E2566_13320 [Pectobacterium punjabense]|uniref:Integrase catalytic domain-containing protein n=1 Tax=Pectobacterium punjabense TaxID=2108399 RepID=A0ABX6L8A9_9GAMM|nr:IS3 family transposase [Pectobacterium punjabense]QJA22515.1 hypothetical protein E2566_13320 [Pectobacterium punjabense]
MNQRRAGKSKEFISREQAMDTIFDYIEMFYNRRHKY